MSCKPICKLCNHLVISQSVTFNGTDLVINLPAGSYYNNEKYCIVVAQAIPSTTTINAGVVITIGTGTQQYRLTTKCCRPASACNIKTRTRYSTCVETSNTTANFRLLGNSCCYQASQLSSVNGTAPVAEPATPAVASDVAVASVESVSGGKKS